MPREWYVYAIRMDDEIVYIGKGCGARCRVSAKRIGGQSEILERFDKERMAHAAERRLIAEHLPAYNKTPGGEGHSRKRHRRFKWELEINRVGSRRYAARFLLTKLNSDNCVQFGLSKVDLNRMREVANGPWA